jgi:hypothetical protein
MVWTAFSLLKVNPKLLWGLEDVGVRVWSVFSLLKVNPKLLWGLEDVGVRVWTAFRLLKVNPKLLWGLDDVGVRVWTAFRLLKVNPKLLWGLEDVGVRVLTAFSLLKVNPKLLWGLEDVGVRVWTAFNWLRVRSWFLQDPAYMIKGISGAVLSTVTRTLFHNLAVHHSEYSLPDRIKLLPRTSILGSISVRSPAILTDAIQPRQIFGYYLKFGHCRFLLHTFQFIIQYLFYLLITVLTFDQRPYTDQENSNF